MHLEECDRAGLHHVLRSVDLRRRGCAIDIPFVLPYTREPLAVSAGESGVEGGAHLDSEVLWDDGERVSYGGVDKSAVIPEFPQVVEFAESRVAASRAVEGDVAVVRNGVSGECIELAISHRRLIHPQRHGDGAGHRGVRSCDRERPGLALQQLLLRAVTHLPALGQVDVQRDALERVSAHGEPQQTNARLTGPAGQVAALRPSECATDSGDGAYQTIHRQPLRIHLRLRAERRLVVEQPMTAVPPAARGEHHRQACDLGSGYGAIAIAQPAVDLRAQSVGAPGQQCGADVERE